MIPFVNVVIATVPSAVILLWAYRRDNARHEAPRVVVKAFLLGFLAIAAAITIGFVVSPLQDRLSPIAALLFRAFIVAALVEECAKYAVVRLFVERNPEFDEVADGLVYAMAASLGFALLENAFYITGSTFTLIMRGITAVPLHATAGGIMGYYIGRGHFSDSRESIKGLFGAVVLHGVYDALVFAGLYWSLAIIPLVIASGLLVVRLFRKAIQQDVDAGRVTLADGPFDLPRP